MKRIEFVVNVFASLPSLFFSLIDNTKVRSLALAGKDRKCVCISR